jgi:hypothetical protein
MSAIQRSLIKEYAATAANSICEQTIAFLKEIKDTLSGDDSPLENTWEEICVQVQDEQSFHWAVYLEMMYETVSGKIGHLPRHDLVALWMQTDEGMDWLRYREKSEEGDHPLYQREDLSMSIVPINHEEIAQYIIDQFLLPAAGEFTNMNIEAYLDGETAYDVLKRRLVNLMPLDSMIIDLWDWDIHFEDETFDDIKSAAFCTDDEIESYAATLADDFEGWIDEYGMDYNQPGWDSHEQFSAWIKEECLNFMKQWRANVRQEFGR